jgi:hypothetical protein
VAATLHRLRDHLVKRINALREKVE